MHWAVHKWLRLWLAACRTACGASRDVRRYGVTFHALRTRQAGARRFISFHLLVPDAWPVVQAHRLSEEIASSCSKSS